MVSTFPLVLMCVWCALAIEYAPTKELKRHFESHMKNMLADIGGTLLKAENKLADKGRSLPEL